MKNTKKEMRLFSFFDYDGMAEHFEKMAAKGWILEKITRNRFVYSKSEPQNIKFAVTYYAKRSDFDPSITEGQMDFNEYCAAAGWQFIGSIAQMHVYCNKNENPLPLETDPAVQVANVHRAMKGNFLLSAWLVVALSLAIIGLHASGVLLNPTYQLVDDSPFFIVLIYLTLTALMGRELITYYSWKKKAVRAAEEGYRIPSGKSNIPFQIGALIWVLGIGAVYVMNMLTEVKPVFMLSVYRAVGGTMVVTVVTKEGLKKLNAPRNLNRVLTFTLPFVYMFAATGLMISYIMKNDINISRDKPQPVETYSYMNYEWDVYKENIPLKLEHFYTAEEIDESIYSYEKDTQEGMAASKYSYRQEVRMDVQSDLPDIRYDVYETKFRWAYNLLFNDLYNEVHLPYDDVPEEYRHKLAEENRSEWGAVKAYRQYEQTFPTGKYLLCFEDKIVELRYYEELTPQQKKVIGDRLQFVFIDF